MEDGSDYEYDETSVIVELNGVIEQDFLSKITRAKILGIDTAKPLVQIDDFTFTGEYQETMGTHMLFEDKTPVDVEGNPATDEKQLEFHSLSNKKLSMQRVFLKKNDVKGMQKEESIDTETKVATKEVMEEPMPSTSSATSDDKT